MSRLKPNRRNRCPEEVEAAVVALALEYPAYGQVRAADKLLELKGHQLSPAGCEAFGSAMDWRRSGSG